MIFQISALYFLKSSNKKHFREEKEMKKNLVEFAFNGSIHYFIGLFKNKRFMLDEIV